MKCSWCGALVAAGQTSCLRCGVVIAPIATAKSGWGKLPGRKGLTKLQFGKSACQIEGTYVPVADFALAPEDRITFAHHVMLWKDPTVSVTTKSQNGSWKTLAGSSQVMMDARGPGHIAFSHDSPGELITIPIEPGQHVHVRQQAQSLKQERFLNPQKHLFLAATANVTYTFLNSGIWFHTEGGALQEDHRYPVGKTMDSFGADGAPGLLLLHAAGNVFVRQLAAGQNILIKPAALVFKDSTVKMDLHYEFHSNAQLIPRTTRYHTKGYIWLRLHGPGRVAVQSVFERVEGEELFSLAYNKHSPMTVSPAEMMPPAPSPPASVDSNAGYGCLKVGTFLAVIDVAGVVLFRSAVLGPQSNMNNINDHPTALILLVVNGILAFTLLLTAMALIAQARARSRKARGKI